MGEAEEILRLGDGRSVVIRPARAGDAAALHAYIRELGCSTPFILTYTDDVPTPDAVQERLDRALTGGGYSLVGVDPQAGLVVANVSYGFSGRKKLAHAAELGMGVLAGWQGLGLGSRMLRRSIDDLRSTDSILRLELTVMKENAGARSMYTRAGFIEEGVKSRSILQPDGSFRDEIIMGMWIGEDADHG